MIVVDDLDPHTPVVVGVGQVAERINDADYQGRSPIDLAVDAARAAVVDAGTDMNAVLSAIDTLAATRQFDNSSPGAPAPLGKSAKFPVSVAQRLGCSPRRTVLEVAGGQSPQHLLNEFSRAISAGATDVVLLTGAEAISTIRHLAKGENRPDFSDDPRDPDGTYEDRGFGLAGLVSMEQAAHGLRSAPAQYALLENARRALQGESRERYAASMGKLFAPFTDVAAANPLSAAPERRTPDELTTVTERNRMIADPYSRFLVARDQVNQAAAVLIVSLEAARRLGVPKDKWVFLHGHADLHERNLFERRSFAEAPSAAMAVRHALDAADLKLDDIEFMDLYSCFPIAVTNLTDALGLTTDDRRGLTLTGGLPFFGGAGNNYSMHAIAEAVGRVRAKPGSFALVSANGGILSKTSVGIYGTTPAPLHADDSKALQKQIDALEAPALAAHPTGWATIETYTITHGKGGKTGIVVGRLEGGDERFIAQVASGDAELLALLEQTDQPIGTRFFVTALGPGNRATISDRVAAELFPRTTPRLRTDYEFVTVRREGRTLVVIINRPESRNALHPPAHEELEEVFDAFFADPELWVAIITGAGDKAFSAGNDLLYSTSGKPMYIPLTGFAGLTSRRNMTKPVRRRRWAGSFTASDPANGGERDDLDRQAHRRRRETRGVYLTFRTEASYTSAGCQS